MKSPPLGVEFVARQAAAHRGCTHVEVQGIRTTAQGWYVFLQGTYQGQLHRFRADIVATSATTFRLVAFHFIWGENEE